MPSPFAPCPFCQSLDLRVEHIGDEAQPFFLVTCRNCEADGPIKNTEAEALEAWNTRPVTDGNGQN